MVKPCSENMISSEKEGVKTRKSYAFYKKRGKPVHSRFSKARISPSFRVRPTCWGLNFPFNNTVSPAPGCLIAFLIFP